MSSRAAVLRWARQMATVPSTEATTSVAVCLAVQSLQTYQCDMALAGAVSVRLPQRRGYLHEEGLILAPDGHCRAFDADAAGTVSSNGLGIVVLRRLRDALADGNTIYAVIKGAALNNDGSAKVGFTAPSVDGHAQVISMAQMLGGIDPATISYIEAHGTGTALGDPIEFAALDQVFRERCGGGHGREGQSVPKDSWPGRDARIHHWLHNISQEITLPQPNCR